MSERKLSLTDLVKLSDKAVGWKRLPDKYESHSSPDMLDYYSTDERTVRKSYACYVGNVYLRVFHEHTEHYPWPSGETTHTNTYGISATVDGVSVGEHTTSKIKGVYNSVCSAHQWQKKEQREQKRTSAIGKARKVLNKR